MAALHGLVVLGVLFLVATGSAAPATFSSTAPGGDVNAAAARAAVSSACSGILAEWNVNSSGFLEVCNEPSFQAAYDLRGVQDFFTGGSGGRGYAFDYYGFGWSATCQNRTWAGQTCAEQEYWSVNQSSNAAAGPFFEEGPPVCAGCPARAVPPSTAGLLLVGLVGVAAASTGILALRRRRRGRGPAPPPPVGPPPP